MLSLFKSRLFAFVRSKSVVLVLTGTVFLTGASAQTYNLFYQPGSNMQSTGNSLFVYCRSIQTGAIQYWCPVHIITGLYLYTNAHFHDDINHPWSGVGCVDSFQCNDFIPWFVYGNTTWKGSIHIKMLTTKVGQAEAIGGDTYPYGGYFDDALDYVVGYNDIYYNHHPEIWHPTGGTDTGANTGHGSTDYNWWMMSTPAYGLYYTTQDYLLSHPGQQRVCTNDMALPFGGKFDICALPGTPGCSGTKPWESPQTSHDRGTAADVAGPGGFQCPSAYQVNVSQFLIACIARGALFQNSIAHGNHAHCNWASPSTYVH